MVVKFVANADNININHILSLNNNSSTIGELRIGNHTTNGSILTLNTLGNLGISNTSPVYKLDVSGDINLTGTLRQNGILFEKSQWSYSDNNIYFTNGNVITKNIIPSENEIYNLGSAALKWKDLYLSGTTIHLGNGSLRYNNSALSLNTDDVLKSSQTVVATPNVDPFTKGSTISDLNASTGIKEFALDFTGDKILAVFDSITFKSSTNAGLSFDNKTISNSGNLKNCSVSSDFTHHVLSDSTYLYISHDSGSTYVSAGNTGYTYTAVHISNDGNYVAGCYIKNSAVYINESSDGGTTFTEALVFNAGYSTQVIKSLYINNIRTVYVCSGPLLNRRIGNGTWSLKKNVGESNGHFDVSDDGRYVIVTSKFHYSLSTDYGENFSDIDRGPLAWPVVKTFLSSTGQFMVIIGNNSWMYTNNFGASGSFIVGGSAINNWDYANVSKGFAEFPKNASKAYIIQNSTDSGGELMMKYINQNLGTVINQTSLTISNKIGIGISTPEYPLHINTYVNNQTYRGWLIYWNYNNTPINGFSGPNGSGVGDNVSLFANSGIWSNSKYILSSDIRIKKNIQDINDSSALDILRLIQPKTYNYIDTITRTDQPVYGFSAQQIKTVLPYAVSLEKQYIPNIFSMVTIGNNGNRLILPQNTNTSVLQNQLTTGNLLIPIKCYDELNSIVKANIVSILDEHTVEIDKPITSGNNIFFYGQEINDFHTLNKDAIWTIATAALQEVDRQLQETKSELQNTKLDLQQKIINLEQRLLSLEQN